MAIVKDEVTGLHKDDVTGQYYEQIPAGGVGGGQTSFTMKAVDVPAHIVAQKAAGAAKEAAKIANEKAEALAKEAAEQRRAEDERVRLSRAEEDKLRAASRHTQDERARSTGFPTGTGGAGGIGGMTGTKPDTFAAG